MKVITAVEPLVHDGADVVGCPSVFLAGGITNCPQWQQEVIDRLQGYEIECTILNPRRANFPIGDPSAAREQSSV